MARSQDPDSAGSQFFICLADARFLDKQYTAFGKLIKGDDVLGKLGDTPTTHGGGGEKSRPAERVAVESIKIVPAKLGIRSDPALAQNFLQAVWAIFGSSPFARWASARRARAAA